MKGTQVLQKLQAWKIKDKPHEGALLYERRGFYSFEDLRKNLSRQGD
jgi:hypothetical protein